MKILDHATAFACGVVTTVIACTVIADLRAQPVARSVVDACANADGTLRLVDPDDSCRAGERQVRLRQPELGDPKDEPKEAPALSGLEQRVRDLEEKAAKGRLMASRVIAPFEVVNDDGHVVFKVEDRYVWFNNSNGKSVGRVVMNESGGYFEAHSATAKLQAVLGAVDKKVNLFIQENDQPRINLGLGDSGQYGLRVFDPGGKMVAGIGQAALGDGVVTIGDTQGNQRAALYVEPKAGGVLRILNAGGKGVAELSATPSGNGLMELFNKDGVKMVEAGVADNIGVVRAGPSSFAPGVGILGLPGSYIAGKAAR